MPCLKGTPNNSNDDDNATETTVAEEATTTDVPQQPAVRELTQTDRINKHLLKSFLERINTDNNLMDNAIVRNDNNVMDDFED